MPARFKTSKAVGAVFGLTPRRHQSGEIDRMGGISRCGDAMMRTMLFGAAQVMLTRTIKWSWLKAWGVKIARRRGMKRAIVAVARRMAVIMHRMWIDGTNSAGQIPTLRSLKRQGETEKEKLKFRRLVERCPSQGRWLRRVRLVPCPRRQSYGKDVR